MREPLQPIEAELQRPWLRRFDFRTILDVGANVGQFASWARAAFPSASIYSFEPLPDCCSALRSRFASDNKFTAFEIAVGASSTSATMNRNEFSPSSSLFAMKDTHQSAFPFAAKTHEISVEVRRLDDLLDANALERPMLLKIDVQGYEQQALEGATKTLAACDLALLEISLEPLYENEPSFDDIYRMMSTRGFELRAILDTLRRPSDGKPLQVDAVFGPK